MLLGEADNTCSLLIMYILQLLTGLTGMLCVYVCV